jgi:hypothetical protein
MVIGYWVNGYLSKTAIRKWLLVIGLMVIDSKPKSAFRHPQSDIRNPTSDIRKWLLVNGYCLHSEIRNPKFTTRNHS